jgi:hypothetical protein
MFSFEERIDVHSELYDVMHQKMKKKLLKNKEEAWNTASTVSGNVYFSKAKA